MNSIRCYYFYLLRKHFLSWRMLAVSILTVLTMDTFLAPLRIYSREQNVKMSQWGFALIWHNKYVGLCFMLIFIFAAAIFPEDRKGDCYIISRIGISKWVAGQSLYLLTFGWIYTLFLFLIQNMLLCSVMEFASEWGKGWATLSNDNVILHYKIYTTVPFLVVCNYDPLRANVLVAIILGLLLGMMGMLIFWLNFYSKTAGPLAASALVFMSLAAAKNSSLLKYSPTSWISLNGHYSITNTDQPTLTYMIGQLLLWTILFFLLSKLRAGRTQENNRRNRKWKKISWK
ncbi:MAG: hypothetical protein HDR71_10575 [Lachnospiraceae bacterium]|nr:hypothetical protein [Lachnospiraceae bacterium]